MTTSDSRVWSWTHAARSSPSSDVGRRSRPSPSSRWYSYQRIHLRTALSDTPYLRPAARKLNAIIHPRVGARMAELEQAAGRGAIVVHDVPLIAENGRADAYDVVVVVDVPPRIQIERLVRYRGMTRDQARARMAAQASREQRLAIAGIVIDNSGSLTELDRQVGDLWAELRRRAAAAAS